MEAVHELGLSMALGNESSPLPMPRLKLLMYLGFGDHQDGSHDPDDEKKGEEEDVLARWVGERCRSSKWV